jgi:GNAT superfamily N-acetyltransferase
MPNITKALQKAKGKLFPLGWWHILRTMRAKQFEQIDFLLYATRPDYQKKGINALLFKDLIPIFKKYGVKYSESGPILEGSAIGTAQLEYFNSKRHKRRRTYRIEL